MNIGLDSDCLAICDMRENGVDPVVRDLRKQSEAINREVISPCVLASSIFASFKSTILIL